MGSNEIKREPGTENDSDGMHMNRNSSVSTSASSSNMSSEVYVKQEGKEISEMQPSPSFIGPSPISPMEYEFKLESNTNFKSEPDMNPQSNLISPGPPSGSGLTTYSQSSSSGYYQDFSQSPVQQSPFNNFQSSFLINGAYDDQFYNRGNINSRYHPYGRSPLPTPSPGASMVDIKEERLTPGTPEILDLDSQKVLNGNANQQNQLAPLPPMWRPHEQFPSPGNSSSGICTSSGLVGSSGLRPSSTGLDSPSGLVTTPSGIGASPAGLGSSPFGVGPSPSGLGPSPTGLGGSISALGPSPTGLRQSTGLGPSPSGLVSSTGVGPPASSLGSSVSGSISSSLGISHGLGPSQINMLPPLQQHSYGNQPIHQNHQVISVSSNSPGYQTSNMMPSYYSQGLSVNSGINNNSPVQFASTPTPSPSPREGPPTEYPSNVKRAKSFKCEDCNKWFTSHGHLKRHYNTTLHKNMTKLNTSSGNTQATAPDITRPPIVSPGSKSIGETSTASSHDEESNLSTNDSLEPASNTFQPVGSAFQPPTAAVTNYSSQNVPYPGSAIAIGHVNSSHTSHPSYTQPHSFPSEQPLTAPTMYHGHFSTNSSYPSQPTVTGNGPFFLANNYIYHPQQGGSHGPGFHSMNEYPGPSPVDGLNSYRLENDKISHQYIVSTESTPRISPEPSVDTGSEASMDSSESSSTGPVDNYKCNDCNKTFNRMCYLTQHRSTYHEGEKPFKCGTCGKRFTDEGTFTDHQGKHAGEKPYKCEVCPKQFNHKTDLRRHMCLHTGEKPFSCEQCGKGFIRKDHMLKHFQTHRKKALAAANSATTHPSMSQNPSGYTSHPGLPPPHGSLPHQTHGPRGHPHVVAPPVY